jgi:hypothetical protein
MPARPPARYAATRRYHSARNKKMINDDGFTTSELPKPGTRRVNPQGPRHTHTIAAGGIQSRCPRDAADATLSEIGDQVRYQIRIQGHLDSTWSEWFDGLTIVNLADGVTMLEGDLVDQPALHGVLHKIRDLGLPLLAVVKVIEGHTDGCPEAPAGGC